MDKIVLTDAKMKMLSTVWDEINELGTVMVTPNDDEDTLMDAVADASLLIICYAPVSRKVIEAGKGLKAILKWGVGVDSIDIDAANEHRLPVCHCPNYGSATIADHSFALLIALARKLVPLVNFTRQKGWLWPEPSRTWAGYDLEGKTVGLIGFGRIGQKMAQRCIGFGMRIKAYDPRVKHSIPGLSYVELTNVEEILKGADFLSLHAVLKPENQGLIGEKELNLMKPTAFIINTARGALIQENALYRALKEKRIGGAAIDVFDPEPIDSSYPLYELDNVLLTPHFAYYTNEAEERLDRECLNSARCILKDQTLVNVKNGQALSEIGEPVRWLPYGEMATPGSP